jgi:hypothetical protein
MEPTGRDPLAGRRIGHYRLEKRLGEGGRRTMAALAHPNVVALLDAGSRLLEAKLQRVK